MKNDENREKENYQLKLLIIIAKTTVNKSIEKILRCFPILKRTLINLRRNKEERQDSS